MKVNSVRKSVLLKKKQARKKHQDVGLRKAAAFVRNERGFRYFGGEKIAR
jgi:hypothetical protein